MIFRFILTSLLLAAHAPAQAHGIWFAQRSGDLALIYGHGAEDLDIIKRIPKVKGIEGFDELGQPSSVAFKTTDRLLLVDVSSNPKIIATTLDNGLWSQTADGKWLPVGRRDAPDARLSGHYIKYAVHIRGALKATFPIIPQQRLQLAPVDQRLPEKAGTLMKLRATFDGKPLPRAEVLPDYINDPDGRTLKTDRNGMISIRIRNQGLNVITIRHESASADRSETDKVEHYASLSFVLPHKPE